MQAEPDDYVAQVEAWHAARDQRLRAPDGWVALVGLHWLADGEHRFGEEPSNPIHLTGRGVPSVGGHLRLTDGRVSIRPEPDTDLRTEGQPIRGELALEDDLSGEPTVVELGSLRLHIIRRGDRVGLRVRDADSPALGAFAGVPHFPIDPAWRLVARFEPADGPRVIPVPDVLGDVSDHPSPGRVAISGSGHEHRLDALETDDDQLWLIFGDATNGVETYEGGRFLYAEAPAPDGSVIVDFNLAYNPPCVFSPYATCPLPWAANRLPMRIPAGEMLPPGPRQ